MRFAASAEEAAESDSVFLKLSANLAALPSADDKAFAGTSAFCSCCSSMPMRSADAADDAADSASAVFNCSINFSALSAASSAPPSRLTKFLRSSFSSDSAAPHFCEVATNCAFVLASSAFFCANLASSSAIRPDARSSYPRGRAAASCASSADTAMDLRRAALGADDGDEVPVGLGSDGGDVGGEESPADVASVRDALRAKFGFGFCSPFPLFVFRMF
mmetsp:Transcript_58297/g.103555  ORF Transcript_58297/g.103555 Transcript_58297/m.103555 type:complete len:219 (-) Transcript_58297:321-977(-)